MLKPISFVLDTINNSTVLLDSNIRQGDDLIFTIKLFQKGTSLNLTGQTARIIVRRPNGYDTEIKTGNNLLSVSNNVITASFKGEYLVTDSVGDCLLEIVTTDSIGGSTSNRCIFTVQESLSNNLIVKLDDKIDTLQEIDAFIAEFNSNREQLEVDNALAIQNIASLDTKNASAVINYTRLETDITNGTTVAVRLETDIANGTTLATKLETDIANGTTVDNNLILRIAKALEVIAQLQNVNWAEIRSFIALVEQILNGMSLTDENGTELTDENGTVLTM